MSRPSRFINRDGNIQDVPPIAEPVPENRAVPEPDWRFHYEFMKRKLAERDAEIARLRCQLDYANGLIRGLHGVIDWQDARFSWSKRLLRLFEPLFA